MALSETSKVWDIYLKWHEYHLEKKDKDEFTGIEQSQNPDLLRADGRFQLHTTAITASEVDVFKNFTKLSKS